MESTAQAGECHLFGLFLSAKSQSHGQNSLHFQNNGCQLERLVRFHEELMLLTQATLAQRRSSIAPTRKQSELDRRVTAAYVVDRDEHEPAALPLGFRQSKNLHAVYQYLPLKAYFSPFLR